MNIEIFESVKIETFELVMRIGTSTSSSLATPAASLATAAAGTEPIVRVRIRVMTFDTQPTTLSSTANNESNSNRWPPVSVSATKRKAQWAIVNLSWATGAVKLEMSVREPSVREDQGWD